MRTVPLGDLIRPAGVRAGIDSSHPVFSVTKHAGFVRSDEYFKKQVYSRDLSGYKRVHPGDFAYATIHLDEGAIGIAPAVGLISPMYTVFSVDPNRVDPGYLLRYLKSPRALAEYGRLGKGSAHRRRSIALDALGGLSLPLPPLDDQRRVAAILDGVEAQRARQRILVDRLQALSERIFVGAFGRPLRSGGADRQALGRLAKIIRGASPRPAGDPRYFGDGSVPWLKIGDISREAGPTVRTIKETVTDAGRHKSVLLPPNTLVLTNSATVGLPKIIEPAACIHDGFLAFLDLDESIEQLWLYWALAVSRDDIVRLAPEGTQKNLNGPIVKAIEMAVPSRNRQRAFVEVAERIEEQRNRAQRVTDLQDELFSSLQSRAFGDES